MTAKAMLRQYKGNLPRVRGAFMMIRSGKYIYSPKRGTVASRSSDGSLQ